MRRPACAAPCATPAGSTRAASGSSCACRSASTAASARSSSPAATTASCWSPVPPRRRSCGWSRLRRPVEIVVSDDTAARLPAACTRPAAGPGRLLRSAPPGAGDPPPERAWHPPGDRLESALSPLLRAHLQAGAGAPEHRLVTVAFLRFGGVDGLLERGRTRGRRGARSTSSSSQDRRRSREARRLPARLGRRRGRRQAAPDRRRTDRLGRRRRAHAARAPGDPRRSRAAAREDRREPRRRVRRRHRTARIAAPTP